jgi:glycosyltransferase involved in cell wall biosynthesis
MVRRLAGAESLILCVAPGCLASLSLSVPQPPVRALMVANLVPGKGVAELLASLASRIHATDALDLAIVGGARHDPRYAQQCHALAKDARLRGRVRFLGELSPEQTQAHLAACNLLVSASTMESYGMALAEARTVGVPILARRGGHVATLVGGQWGGEVFLNTEDLVAAVLMLCCTPTEHRRRIQLARARALPARPWSLAASEFTAQLAKLLSPGLRAQTNPFRQEGIHRVG